MNQSSYLPISDYGFIADCHSTALVSRSGSIDWCCMPRIDSGSCFGRILDWDQGGYCEITPTDPYKVSRRYVQDTLVLETVFRTEGGEVCLFDCFPMRRGGKQDPYQQILRVVEGVAGRVALSLKIVPRLDYGAIKPWIRRYRGEHYAVIGGSDGLLISGDFHLQKDGRHDLIGTVTIEKGQRARLSVLYRPPEALGEGVVDVPSSEELDQRLDETIRWWRSWSAQGKAPGPYREIVRRSAIVLKGLTNAPTGAIAAASTTSLPEAPGGSRNWDYRFSWIRDSSFTVRSLAEIGHFREANNFRRFVERSAAGSAEEIQILFGVGGERRLHEYEIRELDGYRGAKPVRVGNAAGGQRQLDVYGELLDLTWNWHLRGHSPDDDYWEFLLELLDATVRSWNKPDQGIWEMRGKPRHFVFSKAMCWAAMERGIKLAEDLGRKAPVDRWKSVRDEIRLTVEEEGYDAKRGIFIQAFGFPEMDASLLLLPTVDFVEYGDPRMIRTTRAIREELEEYGLLRRYRMGNDEMEDREGVFLACSFWLVETLARQGSLKEAKDLFQRVLAAGNDLGLFSEEYNPVTGEMLGNFPQGLTHLSLISAAVALTENGKGKKKAAFSASVGD